MNQTVESQSEVLHYEHVGAYLRDARLYYQLEVEEIAAQIHIRPKYLHAIEEGRMDDLPGRVYTLGYLQNYAEFLRLNAQEIISYYEQQLQGDQRPPARTPFKLTSVNPQKSALPNGLWVFLLLALVIVIVVWLLYPQLVGESDNRPASHASSIVRIDAVPDRIRQHANNALILTDRNKQCLRTNTPIYFPPCYGVQTVNIPTLVIPIRPIVERP